MNETLKGVAHIGAELAAAKADLQRELERHRKTWRQLEQVTGLLREIRDVFSTHRNEVGDYWTQRIDAALSQQAEPVEPAPVNQCDGCQAGVPVDENGNHRMGKPGGYADLMRCEKARYVSEPAPAQDEREAPEVFAYRWKSSNHTVPNLTADQPPSASIHGYDYILPLMTVAQHERIVASLARPAQNSSAAQQILDLIMEECRYWHGRDEARRGGFACLYAQAKEIADNAAATAQPEHRPVAMVDANDDGMWADILPDVTVKVGQMLYAAPIAQTAPQGKFRMGDLVKKTTGSEWEGHICGTYSTELTPEGYAVESAAHRGSVQIYPAKALEPVPMDAKEE